MNVIWGIDLNIDVVSLCEASIPIKLALKKQILVFLLLNRTLQESSHHSLASAALSLISQIIVSGVLTPDAASHKSIKQFIQFITCGRISHIWMVHAQGKKKTKSS